MADRLTPLDASFLHIEEDGVSQMHIGCTAVFEGPAPPYTERSDRVPSSVRLGVDHRR